MARFLIAVVIALFAIPNVATATDFQVTKKGDIVTVSGDAEVVQQIAESFFDKLNPDWRQCPEAVKQMKRSYPFTESVSFDMSLEPCRAAFSHAIVDIVQLE